MRDGSICDVRKKSGKGAAQRFIRDLDAIDAYLDDVDSSALSASSRTACYELAIIKAAVALERAVLECLVVAINNDPTTLTAATGVTFPRHLDSKVTEFLIVGDGYFDFRGGKDGLTKQVLRFVPKTHWLAVAIRNADKPTLDKLVALRNWAAHESTKGRKTALGLIGGNSARAGTWLKVNKRMRAFTRELRELADAIDASAPY